MEFELALEWLSVYTYIQSHTHAHKHTQRRSSLLSSSPIFNCIADVNNVTCVLLTWVFPLLVIIPSTVMSFLVKCKNSYWFSFASCGSRVTMKWMMEEGFAFVCCIVCWGEKKWNAREAFLARWHLSHFAASHGSFSAWTRIPLDSPTQGPTAGRVHSFDNNRRPCVCGPSRRRCFVSRAVVKSECTSISQTPHTRLCSICSFKS